MDIEEALVAHLKAQPGLVGLIGNRIYPDEREQDCASPAVAYMTISDVPNRTLDGQDALAQPYVQFTVYATTKAEAKAVANQIKSILIDYQGDMQGVIVQLIELENEMPGIYRESDGSTPERIIDLEFRIHYIRS